MTAVLETTTTVTVNGAELAGALPKKDDMQRDPLSSAQHGLCESTSGSMRRPRWQS